MQTKNALAEQEREMLKKQLAATGSVGVGLLGLDANEMEAELKRVMAQNEQLKAELEALSHVEAKLVAKNKNHRDQRKGFLWL